MIEKRHTVRKYLDKPLDVDLVSLLNARIEQNNKLYDLTFKLVTNESDGISSLAKIMSNNTVQNYIILAGKECSSLDEKIGYCGADLILYAQSLGLNTWWCGGMFNGKNALKHLDDKDVRVNGVIAIGYGKTQGVPHKSKTADQISHYQGVVPVLSTTFTISLVFLAEYDSKIAKTVLVQPLAEAICIAIAPSTSSFARILAPKLRRIVTISEYP